MSILLCSSKTFEIACFCYDGKSCLCFDPEEAGELMNILLILFVRCKLLDPLVKTFQLISKIVVCKQVFFEYLLIQPLRL